jgi:predicted ATP-dependent Lon-type protease
MDGLRHMAATPWGISHLIYLQAVALHGGRTRQSLSTSVTRPADPGNISIQLVNGLNLFTLDKWLRLLIKRIPFEPLHLGKMHRTYEHCA